jgi:SAM-dependent methyltransferase
MDEMSCPECTFHIRTRDGIVHALPPERAAHYARFIADYERIRAAEGRGSQNEAFYLGLPYKDTTGRNSGQWKIRARSFEYLMAHVLHPAAGHKRILDLGAGNCWMSFRLALAGYEPVAVDLLTNEHDGLAAAVHYHNYLHQSLPRFQAELTSLPFQDEQFDAVIFNASFHYSEDYERILTEALRCLRHGGQVIISDTPWYSSEASGSLMIAERRASFLERFGTASDSIRSLEYLTDDRLRALAQKLCIRWTIHSPWHGLAWAMRPWVAIVRHRREPSRFRIYTATKTHG